MRKLSQIWFNIQGFLFPFIEKEIEEPLTEKLKQLVATLELIRIEDFVHIPEYWLNVIQFYFSSHYLSGIII